LSFENTQISLEEDANRLNTAKNMIMVGIITKNVVAGFEPVAW
jgi:hypothetical protein